jgi:predicted CoA-substrate-specific enzyme activase
MITAGFDIGTRVIKVCIVDDTEILGFAKSEIETDVEKIIETIYENTLRNIGLKRRDIKKIIATGYCSELVKDAAYTISEFPCIARAAYHLDNNIRTVIDIGNLFVCVATINDNGFFDDSISNEKCATGSGGFLEMASEAIEIPFESITESALQSKAGKSYIITSSCAVFAESEIISQVNNGMDKNDIIAGVINSIVLRVVSLLEKINVRDKICLIGGVSKVEAFRLKFEEMISKKTSTLSVDPQIIAAYGAALIAQGNKPVHDRKRVSDLHQAGQA